MSELTREQIESLFPPGEPHTVLTWSPKERAAIDELMTSQGLSEQAVMRQALSHYQQIVHRIRAGEICTWSGDAERIADFTGEPHTSAARERLAQEKERLIKKAAEWREAVERDKMRPGRSAKGSGEIAIAEANLHDAVGYVARAQAALDALTGGPQDG